MGYKESLAILLVLGILSIEPAGAVQMESLNQVNSPGMLNLDDKNLNTVNESIINNQNNNDEFYKLKTNKLFNNCKNTFKLALNKVKKHKYHKSLQNPLTTIHNNKQLHSSSHKTSTNSVKSMERNVDIFDDKNTKNNEANLNNTADINETALNNVTGENKITFNQTVQNNTNGIISNNITDENKTTFNQTGNETITNGTNVNGTSLDNTDENKTVSKNDNSTKAHVLNTIENVGYAFAAIAGCFAVGAAVAPEGVTKTICVVGAIACGVAAAVCFVAYIFVDWFW